MFILSMLGENTFAFLGWIPEQPKQLWVGVLIVGWYGGVKQFYFRPNIPSNKLYMYDTIFAWKQWFHSAIYVTDT